MLDWLWRTGTLAGPFLVPVAVLIFIKRPGFRFTWRSQHLFTQLFFLMYAFGLLLFAAHAYALGHGAGEFFTAFWGSPAFMTPWCFAGYIAQILSVLALALALNWSMLRQLNPRLSGTVPVHEHVNDSDRAVDAAEALQQKSAQNAHRFGKH